MLDALEVTSTRRAGVAETPAQYAAHAHKIELGRTQPDATGLLHAGHPRAQFGLAQRVAIEGCSAAGLAVDAGIAVCVHLQQPQLCWARRQQQIIARGTAQPVAARAQTPGANVTEPAIAGPQPCQPLRTPLFDVARVLARVHRR